MPEATSDALMGLGMPAQLSAMLGANPNVQAGVGTAQAGATIIKSRNTEITAAGGATAFVFPSAAGVMEPYFLVNSSSTVGLVFVPSGHTLQVAGTGAVAGGSVTVGASGGTTVIWQYKPKNWASR